eukprot:9003302-Ditylum_brightwellii.AAC.1
MNDSRTMIKEIVKDISQAKLKEILPDIVPTVLQQIKASTDKLLRIVRDVPEQTKAMNIDKTSVLITTTQGASNESSLELDKMSAFQSEDNVNLLTQEDEEIKTHKKPSAKSNNKN